MRVQAIRGDKVEIVRYREVYAGANYQQWCMENFLTIPVSGSATITITVTNPTTYVFRKRKRKNAQ
jgi:hypothetical protein